jgi:hypothetical protein
MARWNRMWRTMQEYNVDNWLIGIIKELYAELYRTYIKQENNLSLSKGLWQAYRLSPLLFNIYLKMLREWRRNCCGNSHWWDWSTFLDFCRWSDDVYIERIRYRIYAEAIERTLSLLETDNRYIQNRIYSSKLQHKFSDFNIQWTGETNRPFQIFGRMSY